MNELNRRGPRDILGSGHHSTTPPLRCANTPLLRRSSLPLTPATPELLLYEFTGKSRFATNSESVYSRYAE